ncbi:MAG TPA: FeoB-associated Cys-rich membrane protein [Ohtaekwangia sp.]|nr:FeoB-associated Cys-rich membrane protein [Ohtaekwangia sp.]
MIQQLLVGVIFFCAVFYVVRLVYKSFTAKSGCSSGCGKCALDISKIEKNVKELKV